MVLGSVRWRPWEEYDAYREIEISVLFINNASFDFKNGFLLQPAQNVYCIKYTHVN
jgi:hypothetical protein